MRINKAKRLMLQGKPALGPAAILGAPLVAEMFSLAGFDHVILDLQHGPWDDASTMEAFKYIGQGSAVPMARVQKNDYYAIGRVLDQGALGVIVPMVNSAEEAAAAAFAARYPPRGGRSLGPFGAGSYGSDYIHKADDEIFLAVQIETKEGFDCVEDILAVDGVDGCWIGPWDLGRSMGIDLSRAGGEEALEPAMLHILEACRKMNKISGTWAVGQAKRRLEQGFQFVTVCTDGQLVARGAEEMLQDLDRWRS